MRSAAEERRINSAKRFKRSNSGQFRRCCQAAIAIDASVEDRPGQLDVHQTNTLH